MKQDKDAKSGKAERVFKKIDYSTQTQPLNCIS